MASLGGFTGQGIADEMARGRELGQTDRGLDIEQGRLDVQRDIAGQNAKQAQINAAAEVRQAREVKMGKSVTLIRDFIKDTIPLVRAGSKLVTSPDYTAGAKSIIDDLRKTEEGGRVADLLQNEMEAALGAPQQKKSKVLSTEEVTAKGLPVVENVIYQENQETGAITVEKVGGEKVSFTPAFNEKNELVFASREQLASGQFTPVPPAALLNLQIGGEPQRQMSATGEVVSTAGAPAAGAPITPLPPGEAPQAGGDTGVFPDLSAKDQLTEEDQVDALQSNIAIVDTVLNDLKANPSNYGISGSIKSGVQAIVGGVGSLADGLEAATGTDISAVAETFQKRFLAKGADDVATFFNPTLSKIELWENSIALQLAKLEIGKGSDDIRALAKPLSDAKKVVNLTGITFAKDVEARMTEIKNDPDP